MGVGQGLWEHLSTVKKEESLGFLRDKTLAVDLSYWIVQQQQAVQGRNVRKPHLRLTFFRVINLLVRVGARPLFVVDGKPPLKKYSRTVLNASGKDSSSSGWESSTQGTFKENVEECVVMLECLGVPVLRAEGEAESLCAKLNRRGLVDACVTPDSDAFVHGATCVIKILQADPRDPLVEVYQAVDIKERLGLQQRHLLALALLIGCDYCPEGVPGVGCQGALRLVQCFSDSEILDRLRAFGKGEIPSKVDENPRYDIYEEKQIMVKHKHCSKCGHLGNKRLHSTSGCQFCVSPADEDRLIIGCHQKARGFQCTCQFCIKEACQKKERRSTDWWTKICCKMAATPGFPNEDIISIFLAPDTTLSEDLENLNSSMIQQAPKMEKLESFLGECLFWDATYIRQKMLPWLSQLCLVELAAMNSGATCHVQQKGLISDLYHPCSIERVKIHYSEPLFVLKWETVSNTPESLEWLGMKPNRSQAPKSKLQKVVSEEVGTNAHNKDPDSLSKNGFTTNENMALVRAACPELVKAFDKHQEAKTQKLLKKAKKKRKEDSKDNEKQLLISSYLRTVKRSDNSSSSHHTKKRGHCSDIKIGIDQ